MQVGHGHDDAEQADLARLIAAAKLYETHRDEKTLWDFDETLSTIRARWLLSGGLKMRQGDPHARLVRKLKSCSDPTLDFLRAIVTYAKYFANHKPDAHLHRFLDTTRSKIGEGFFHTSKFAVDPKGWAHLPEAWLEAEQAIERVKLKRLAELRRVMNHG